MYKNIVTQGQNLLDKALELTGSIESTFVMALENGLSVTDDLAVETLIQGTSVINEDLVIQFSNNPPATAISRINQIEINQDCGIGCMVIERTFIVQ